jgi:hypothetical protein
VANEASLETRKEKEQPELQKEKEQPKLQTEREELQQ